MAKLLHNNPGTIKTGVVAFTLLKLQIIFSKNLGVKLTLFDWYQNTSTGLSLVQKILDTFNPKALS